MNLTIRIPIVLAGFVLIAALAPDASAQCAMCGSAAEAGDVGRGLNISILFLLGVVLSAVAGITSLVVRAHVREEQEVARHDAEPGRDLHPERN